jgi:hypothetical protein
MTTVYRAFDADGELLYVGCTDNAEKRLKAHAKGSDWYPDAARWTFEEHATRAAGLAAEAAAIRAELPHCNVVDAEDHPTDCQHPRCAARREAAEAARAEQKAAIDDYVSRVVESFPPLTDEQIKKVGTLLRDP